MTDSKLIFTKVCNSEKNMSELYGLLFKSILLNYRAYLLIGHGTPYFHRRLRKTLGSDVYIISIEDESFEYSWKCMKKNEDVFFIDLNNIKQLIAILTIIGTKIGMKFNKIIMNPPYDGVTHLEILDMCSKVLSNDGQIVNLSPVNWLLDPFANENKKSAYNHYKHLPISDIVIIGLLRDFFPETKRATYTLGIYTLSNKEKADLEHFYQKQVSMNNGVICPSNFAIRLKEILVNYCQGNKSLASHIKSGLADSSTEYTINISKLGGNPGEKAKYPVDPDSPRWGRIFYHGLSNGKTMKDYKKKQKHIQNYDNFDFIEFFSEIEANNWMKSLKTKFMQFVYMFNQTDAHTKVKFVPYMEDYTHEWTDEMFYEYFGLTDEEIKIVEETIQ